MKEEQVLCQVKIFMDNLARGVDPASGEELPQKSVLRREQLVKCFRYVSQALEQELDRQKEAARTWEVEAAVKEEAVGEAETMRTRMAKIVYSLGFTGWRPFLYKAATEWMTQEGYLELGETSAHSSQKDIPFITLKGKAIGLLEVKQQEGGALVFLCSEKCQDFLQGNMDKIMALEQRQWEPFLNCLTSEWHAGFSYLEKPDTLTALLRHINSQFPVNLPRKPSVLQVFSWLKWKGLLEDKFSENGRKGTEPTFEGGQLGLSMNYRRTVLFPLSAQKFIMDNIEQMIRDLASGDAYRLGRVPQKLTGVQEVLATIRLDQKEQTLYEMESKINRVLSSLGEGSCKLPRGVIWIWLRREGYIQSKRAGTKKVSSPTDAGRAMGLCTNPKDYFSVNQAGQHFVVEHLEEICDLYLELLNKE
ncbi:MAG: hypothetical protein HFI33_03270 [Lachnospiraceae bacterium]|nr:hypothetical protein [Lachnospiraceae bacterium]